jgi:hypothetical protein
VRALVGQSHAVGGGSEVTKKRLPAVTSPLFIAQQYKQYTIHFCSIRSGRHANPLKQTPHSLYSSRRILIFSHVITRLRASQQCECHFDT